MTNPARALQQALHAVLIDDTALMALLTGPNVFDDVPQHKAFPYVSYGASQVRDWSTGSESGNEHIVTLHVWSNAPGQRQTQEIVQRLHELLHDQAPTLTGHHLVNLRHEFSEIRREREDDLYHGIVRFRAVTETAVA